MEFSGDARPRPATWPVRWPVRWRVVGWSLLVALVGLTVAGALTVSWPGSYDDLRRAVARGDVDRVEVSPGFAAEQVPWRGGRVEVRVTWRDGLLQREVVVLETRPTADAAQDARLRELPVERPGGTVAGLLSAQPGLVVEPGEGPTGNVRFLGVPAPSAFTVPVAVLAALLVLLLAFGPEPSRATRWAWFWLLGLPLVGPCLLLLLSGATLPAPSPPPGKAGRLTGGRAFLLVLVVSSFATTVTRAGVGS